jgi:hypothetical protein
MTTFEPFTSVLNKFVAGLAQKIAALAEEPDEAGAQLLAGEMLNVIREMQASLLLLEYECEVVLGRG